MRQLKRAYLEITTRCNLHCSFCPGTVRPPADISVENFTRIAGELRKCADFLYLHVMGEPLLHPKLRELMDIAASLGFRIIITTNGTRLPLDFLASHPALHKLQISLQSLEGNGVRDFTSYLDGVCAMAKMTSENGKICVLRLWNNGGANARNGEILHYLEHFFGQENLEPRLAAATRSLKLAPYTYLEPGDKFEWPEPERAAEDDPDRPAFCLALRDQIAVLSDGRAVPCCLDREGSVTLGNLLTDSMEEVLEGPIARDLYNGFTAQKAVFPLCQGCTYRRRFR